MYQGAVPDKSLKWIARENKEASPENKIAVLLTESRFNSDGTINMLHDTPADYAQLMIAFGRDENTTLSYVRRYTIGKDFTLDDLKYLSGAFSGISVDDAVKHYKLIIFKKITILPVNESIAAARLVEQAIGASA